MHGAMYGHVEVVKALFQVSNAGVQDRDGNTAADLARSAKHDDVANLIASMTHAKTEREDLASTVAVAPMSRRARSLTL